MSGVFMRLYWWQSLGIVIGSAFGAAVLQTFALYTNSNESGLLIGKSPPNCQKNIPPSFCCST